MVAALTFAAGYAGIQGLGPGSHRAAKSQLAAFDGSSTTTSAAPTTTTVAPTTTTLAPSPPPAPPTTAAPRPAPAPVRATTAAAPAPAPAATPQSTGEAALARLDYPWQRLGYQVIFQGSNSGLLGKTDCGAKQVFIYVRPTQSVTQVAFVTAFELGHAVDCGTMSDSRRAEWAGIRGFAPGWTWFPSCVCSEDNFGSGDISMVFANWLVPNSGYRWRSNLAGAPSGAQLSQLMPYLRPASVG